MNFDSFQLDERIMSQLHGLEIVTPTEIQLEAIPHITNGSNVLAIAPTGSGKTFAYLLPILHTVINVKISHFNPIALIIVPTRELVRQIAEEIKVLTKETQVFYVSVFAGQNLNKLETMLEEMNDIIIATPGRLLAYIKEGVIKVSDIQMVVLDEVDRLLDMGFGPEITEILSFCPPKQKRQTLLFGATLPGDVEKIARQLQYKEILVEVGRSLIPETIKHEVYETLDKQRFETLVLVLKRKDLGKVLIFTPSQEKTRVLAKQLLELGLELEELHSGLTQRQRNLAISAFETDVDVLVATDIGARGLDIDDITHVISYDVPKVFDDYVHRAGRTGRAGKSGTSILISNPREFKWLENIEKRMKTKLRRIQSLPPVEGKKNTPRSEDDRRKPSKYDSKPSRPRPKGKPRYSKDKPGPKKPAAKKSGSSKYDKYKKYDQDKKRKPKRDKMR
ncbi:MAG: DEAD/DEAH box helicase [Candidatus Heimdallarchaeota archaeon]|nr:DEAD/DEAH box helicase [Candidatus Heimdallarchaeota archaeon]